MNKPPLRELIVFLACLAIATVAAIVGQLSAHVHH